jgi:tripartite-type tricarboxylate transporter receptor subunit TctC
MRGLAVTTQTRWVNLPDVPTFKEAGFPDVVLETEHFLLAPAGTPPQLLQRFTQATLAVMAQGEIKNRVIALGYALVAAGPDAVRERIANNAPFFKELIVSAKIPQIE